MTVPGPPLIVGAPEPIVKLLVSGVSVHVKEVPIEAGWGFIASTVTVAEPFKTQMGPADEPPGAAQLDAGVANARLWLVDVSAVGVGAVLSTALGVAAAPRIAQHLQRRAPSEVIVRLSCRPWARGCRLRIDRERHTDGDRDFAYDPTSEFPA